MLPPFSRRGFLLIISSSSGTGKTTLARKLLAAERQAQEHNMPSALVMSVSCTTRPQSPDEVEGKDYHFLDRQTFDERRHRGDFLEWAEVFGNLYATPHHPVREALERGQDVLFDVDWQGTEQIKRQMEPSSVVSVFLLPPSSKALQERLVQRRRDDPSTLALRLEKASEEISHAKDYDYTIVNGDLDKAFAQLQAILYAERCKRHRQRELERFVERFSTLANERL